MSEFYVYGDTLIPNTVARSADLKAEFEAIEAGLDKLPTEAQLKLGTAQYGTEAGAANAYLVTLPYTPAAYTAGMVVRFKASADNTGASTVNVNSKGVKNIVRADGSALQAGDIDASGVSTIVYDGTNFILTDGLASVVTQTDAIKVLAVAAQVAAEAAQAAAETAQANAETAETNAETAETNTAAIYDSFDDRYLGAKASDPSTDNDLNALVTGAIYWNTASNLFRVWSGTAWGNAITDAALPKAGGSSNPMSGDLYLDNNDIFDIKTAGFDAEYDAGDSGSEKTISFSNGQKQKLRLTAPVTSGNGLTVSFTGCPVGVYQLRLYNNGTGGYSVTWTGISSTNWVGSSAAPTINGAPDASTIVNFFWNGSVPFGSISRVGMV